MSGGRSSQRLIEEILSFVPHTDLISIPPVQMIRGDQSNRNEVKTRPLMAIAPVEIPGKPDSVSRWLIGDGESRIHGFFADSGWHFFAAISTPASGPTDYDWHITDSTTDFDGELAIDFKCSLTGASLGLRFWPPRLEPADWQMFEPGPILQRFNGRSSAYPGDTPPTPIACIETLYSILRNSLVQDPPRPLLATSARASVHVDMNILDTKFGFTKDEEHGMYYPPELESFEDKLHYTGMLTEIAAHVLQRGHESFGSKWPVREVRMVEPLQEFLGCSPTGSTPPLSNKYFGALGSSSSFPDDVVWERYLLQTRNDPKNTPHYLESLKEIAQQRNSEELQMPVMELISVGTQTLSAIEDAFSALDLSMDAIKTDDEIAEVFVSKFESQLLTEAVQQDLSRKVSAIADSRQSMELSRLAMAITMKYNDALSVLNAAEDTPNANLLDRVEARARAGPVAGYEGRMALKTIAVTRQDPELLRRYESMANLESCSPTEGYNRLGVSKDMTDKDILAVFDVRAQEEQGQVLSLRQALRAVGQNRDSQLIDDYLSCRVSDPAVIRGPANEGPVGLWNIGNTCYLNSLLQYYFTIDPLRELVCDFAEESAQQNDDSMRKKTVGGRQVPYAEVERSQQFVKSLGKLFREMTGTTDRYVVPEEDLAYMALVPPEEDVAAQAAERMAREEQENRRRLAVEAAEARIAQTAGMAEHGRHSDEVETELLMEDDDEDGQEEDRDEQLNDAASLSSSTSMTDAVDFEGDSEVRVYEQPLKASSEALEMCVDISSVNSTASHQVADPSRQTSVLLPTRDLHVALQRQQDVTECIENVLFQLEAAVKASSVGPDGEQLDLIKELFYGTTLQTLQNTSGQGERRTKSELFSSLMVDVADGPRDIYSALDNYFSYEVIDMAEGKTVRTVTAKTLPPILQVQIQRVQFDRTTGQPYKSTSPLIFDDVVYLDRYIDSSDPDILARRARVRQWRAAMDSAMLELAECEAPLPNGQSMLETIESGLEWAEQQGLPENDETVVHLFKRRAALQRQLDDLEAKRYNLQKLIDNEFAHLKQHGYKIYALFIHRGQVSFGHYWVYIRDLANDKFFKYNDENVTEAPYDEVVDFSPHNTATPYYLVFVREDFVENLSSRSSSESAQLAPTEELDKQAAQAIAEAVAGAAIAEPENSENSPVKPDNGIEIVDLTNSEYDY